MQALRWRPLAGGTLDVGLRCPECETCFRAVQTADEARRLDLKRLAARTELLDAHDRLVRESMAALAATFEMAFARDLLTADDFGRR